jgi:hypothetical protein
VPAVATCKNCNKGLCPECLTEIENGIACSATCIEQVKILNGLLNTSKNATKRVAGTHYRAMFIYGAMSLLFLFTAFEYSELKIYWITAGCIFLIAALLSWNSANKYKKS